MSKVYGVLREKDRDSRFPWEGTECNRLHEEKRARGGGLADESMSRGTEGVIRSRGSFRF